MTKLNKHNKRFLSVICSFFTVFSCLMPCIVSASDLNFNTAKIVKTDYPTKSVVVANADVKYFGACGDLTADDTNAFISALNYVSGLGGGTVFIPSGCYVITQPISIPANVSLIGDSPEYSHSGISGTVLFSYVGKNDVGGTPFITMGEDSSLKNLSVFYPEQDMTSTNPIPYSWTIKGGAFSTLENIVLLNSYNGIYIYGGAYQTVQNIYGTPLNIGMVSNYITDVARFLNIEFAPEIWENSGLAFTESLSNTNLENHLKNSATGFLYERVDWTTYYGITVKGYNIGMHSRAVSGEYGTVTSDSSAAGGNMYNITLTDCNTCLLADSTTGMGIAITNSKFSATGSNAVAIKLNHSYIYPLQLNNCEISSSGNAVYSKQALITAISSKITAGDNAFYLNGGRIALTDCTINASNNAVCAASTLNGVRVELTNNSMTVANVTKNISSSYITKNTSVSDASDAFASTEDYSVQKATKPSGTAFTYVNLQGDKKGTSLIDARDDISAELQTAINSVYAQGGGVVYLPAGVYRLENPVTIKSGVELRGASDSAVHFSSGGTVICTDYGKFDKDGKALISMEQGAGLSGMHILYDKQTVFDIVDYAYTVRSFGSNIYITNVHFANSAYGIDLKTYRSDNHYISNVYGCFLFEGVSVGGNSENGVIRSFHANPTMWTRYEIYNWDWAGRWGDMEPLLIEHLNRHSVGISLNESKNEKVLFTLVYGAVYGLKLNGCTDATAILSNLDGCSICAEIEGNSKATLVATQMAVEKYNRLYGVRFNQTFNGNVKMIQSILFGNPEKGALVINGTGSARITNFYFSVANEYTAAIVNNPNAVITGYISYSSSYNGEKLYIPTALNYGNVLYNSSISKSTYSSAQYTVTALAGEGGIITPSASYSYGDSALYTVTCNDGYQVLNLKVDGVSVGANNSYLFDNITDNHTISAEFIQVESEKFNWIPTNGSAAFTGDVASQSANNGAVTVNTIANVADSTMVISGVAENFNKYEALEFNIYSTHVLTDWSDLQVSFDGTNWYSTYLCGRFANWRMARIKISRSSVLALGIPKESLSNVNTLYLRFVGTSIYSRSFEISDICFTNSIETEKYEIARNWDVTDVSPLQSNPSLSSVQVVSDNMINFTVSANSNNTKLSFKGEEINLAEYQYLSFDLYAQGDQFVDWSYVGVSGDNYVTEYKVNANKKVDWSYETVTVPTEKLYQNSGDSITDTIYFELCDYSVYNRTVSIGNLRLHGEKAVSSSALLSSISAKVDNNELLRDFDVFTYSYDVASYDFADSLKITVNGYTGKEEIVIDGQHFIGEASKEYDVSNIDGSGLELSVTVISANRKFTHTYSLKVIFTFETVSLGNWLNEYKLSNVDASQISSVEAFVDSYRFSTVINRPTDTDITFNMPEIDPLIVHYIEFDILAEGGALSDWHHLEVYVNNGTVGYCSTVNKEAAAEPWTWKHIQIPIDAFKTTGGKIDALTLRLCGNSQWSVSFRVAAFTLTANANTTAAISGVSIPSSQNLEFTAGNTIINCTVPYDITSVDVIPTLIKPSQSYSVKGNNNLNFGKNTLTLTVASVNGASNVDYTVNVYRNYEVGDVNLDGSVDSLDLVCIKQALLGIRNTKADINADEAFDILDLVALKKILCKR